MNSFGRPSVIIRISEKSPHPRHLDSIRDFESKAYKGSIACLFIYFYFYGGVGLCHIRSSLFPLIPLEDVLSK